MHDIQDAPVDNRGNPDAVGIRAAADNQVVDHSQGEEVGRSLDEAAADNQAEGGHKVSKRLAEDNLLAEGSLREDSLPVDSLLADSLLADTLVADVPPRVLVPALAQAEDSRGRGSQDTLPVAGPPSVLVPPLAQLEDSRGLDGQEPDMDS